MLRIIGPSLCLVDSGKRSTVAARNGSQCVVGSNPIVKVVLSLRNWEVMWRHYYATCRTNDKFVAAIEE